jgi:hypothetical protein
MVEKLRWYAWISRMPDGSWSMIGAALFPDVAMQQPLLTRHPGIADQFRPIAMAHGKRLGQPVRLVVLEEAEVLERYGDLH